MRTLSNDFWEEKAKHSSVFRTFCSLARELKQGDECRTIQQVPTKGFIPQEEGRMRSHMLGCTALIGGGADATGEPLQYNPTPSYPKGTISGGPPCWISFLYEIPNHAFLD